MRKIQIFILSVLVASVSLPAFSMPVYDPFLEKFQVGFYRDPKNIELQDGYPKDLMEPIILDTVWTEAAARVLTPDPENRVSLSTDSFLNGIFTDSREKNSWLFHHHKRIAELEYTVLPEKRPGYVGGKFLLAERLTVRVFLAYEAGLFKQAEKLATRLVKDGPKMGLKPREIFVWDLRQHYLQSLTSTTPLQDDTIWDTLFKLGSFDSGNGWAIWVARQYNLDQPVIPPKAGNAKLAKFLGNLRKTWLSQQDLENAGFSTKYLSALGAQTLPSNKLAAHFLKFPKPPTDFSLQGLWLGGQRRMRKGNARHYEDLAARNDVSPGWKLDLLRRASEIHILEGNWEEGMNDFKKALLLADQGNGTKSLRRRLRQWTEQAIALASAQDDTQRISVLLDLGRNHFNGQDLEVFKSQTERWGPDISSTSAKEEAKQRVSRGLVPDMVIQNAMKADVFAETADDLLWNLWFKWGHCLEGRPHSQMTKTFDHGLESADIQEKRDTILSVVGHQFPDGAIRESLLRMTLEYDIGTLCQWTTTPLQSPVPNLVNKLAESDLERHAILGVALTTGDMRGILAAATKLSAKGLTQAEKQRFLFPLPMNGPVRDAMEAAKSDPALILAVAKNESLFDSAVRSRAGALGFMQIMPFHYDKRGAIFGKAHWSQPSTAIAFGDRLLQEGTLRYNGDPYMTLAAYNAGPKPTSRWLKQLGGSCSRQEYVSWIGYPETRYYVEKVLLDREIYDSIIARSGNN